MSIFKRFREIINSNLHAAADKMEDPAKILDAKYTDLIGERKRIENGVRDSVAHRIMIQNEIEDLKKMIDKAMNQAKLHRLKALSLEEKSSSDADVLASMERHNQLALRHLQDKMRMEEQHANFEEKLEKAHLRINAMKEKSIALQAKMEELRQRKEELKSEIRLAEAEKKISTALSGLDGDFGDIDMTIQRIEEKVKRTKALAEASTEVALESQANVIDLEAVTDIQAELALQNLDVELLGEGHIDKLAPGKDVGSFFTVDVSGGGTWAFRLTEKEEIVASLNEIDQKMSDLLEKEELDHDQFEELYRKIFYIVRKRGKLVGRDIQLSAISSSEGETEEIQLPPEDLEYDEALELLQGKGLMGA